MRVHLHALQLTRSSQHAVEYADAAMLLAGLLDSHNLAQFGVSEHILQAIKQPNIHSQNSQEGRALR